MVDFSGNQNNSPTTANATLHTEGRSSLAKQPIEQACKGWPPLHMGGGGSGGGGGWCILPIFSGVARCCAASVIY